MFYAFVNCGGINLNTYYNQTSSTRIECPAPKRQIDCPYGLSYSNGKCINTPQNPNWVSSDPYEKKSRFGNQFKVQYTSVSKPPSIAIPSPKPPAVSPNARSVQEYLKQIEEERKANEQDRYYSINRDMLLRQHNQRVNNIENEFKNKQAQTINSSRTDFKNKVDVLRQKRADEISPLVSDRQKNIITNEQYEQKSKEIIQKYNNQFEALKSSSQSGLDQALNKINTDRIQAINDSEARKLKELATLDQLYASRSIPIPASMRVPVNLQ